MSFFSRYKNSAYLMLAATAISVILLTAFALTFTSRVNPPSGAYDFPTKTQYGFPFPYKTVLNLEAGSATASFSFLWLALDLAFALAATVIIALSLSRGQIFIGALAVFLLALTFTSAFLVPQAAVSIRQTSSTSSTSATISASSTTGFTSSTSVTQTSTTPFTSTSSTLTGQWQVASWLNPPIHFMVQPYAPDCYYLNPPPDPVYGQPNDACFYLPLNGGYVPSYLDRDIAYQIVFTDDPVPGEEWFYCFNCPGQSFTGEIVPWSSLGIQEAAIKQKDIGIINDGLNLWRVAFSKMGVPNLVTFTETNVQPDLTIYVSRRRGNSGLAGYTLGGLIGLYVGEDTSTNMVTTVRKAITHELGHVLGMGHAMSYGESDNTRGNFYPETFAPIMAQGIDGVVAITTLDVAAVSYIFKNPGSGVFYLIQRGDYQWLVVVAALPGKDVLGICSTAPIPTYCTYDSSLT